MSMTSEVRVFLAAPYSQFMDAATGAVGALWRERLDALRLSFQARGSCVFSAHHNESWGRDWLAAELCTPIDHEAIRRADVVCAVLGNPPSGGVMIELGWASALQVPCLIILPAGGRFSPLVEGLNTVVAADNLAEPPVWDSAAADDIVGRTLSLASRAATLESSPAASIGASHQGPPPGYCSSSACSHDPAVGRGAPGVSELFATSGSLRP
jgi:nucleoside 2-deoxyribosyltransferase